MEYIIVYVDLMGFEEKPKEEAEQTGRPVEDIRNSWRSSIEIRLKNTIKYLSVSLDSWLLYSVDFGNILECIEEILKANLPLEIAVDIKESDQTKESTILELIVLNDNTIKFLKGQIIKKYSEWYKKLHGESPKNTFILFAENKKFDPKPIGSKPDSSSEYYLVNREELKRLVAKFNLDQIFNSINPDILKTLENQSEVNVVANQEESIKVVDSIKKHSSNNFYKIEIIPNTLFGFHAGYNLGIYTKMDIGGSKVNFSIKKLGMVAK